MNCRKARKQLLHNLDNLSPERLSGELAAHLATCEECRKEQEVLREIRCGLRRQSRYSVPSEFSSWVIAKVAATPKPWWTRPIYQWAIPPIATFIILGLCISNRTPSNSTLIAQNNSDYLHAYAQYQGQQAHNNPAEMLAISLENDSALDR
jgi:anti-sigma factor RsiW